MSSYYPRALCRHGNPPLRLWTGRTVWCVLVLILPFARALGQSPVTVTGIVSTQEGKALGDATVEVVGTKWVVTTNSAGTFAVRLHPGRWTIRASRIGYRPAIAEVSVENAPVAGIPLTLVELPLALAGLSVKAPVGGALSTTVTTATIRQLPGLGEPDVFRAVAALPGVSQPNELKGRIHLGGGASDETAITLDGHPLQDPLHLLGALGAFNVAAIDRAEVFIADVHPASASRLSGVVELHTAVPGPKMRTEAILSLLSSSATASRALPNGWGILASARVTYLDKVIALLQPDARIGGDEVPLLGYHDAVLKVGRLVAGWKAEAVAFTTEDHIAVSPSAQEAGDRPLAWGESMVGLRLERSGTRWAFHLRTSADQAVTRLEASNPQRERIDARRLWMTAAGDARFQTTRLELRGGLEFARRKHAYDWRGGKLAARVLSGSVPPLFAGQQRADEPGAFVNASYILPGHANIAGGLRAAEGGGRLYVGPRIVASKGYNAGTVAASYNRRHQFLAEIEEPLEGNIMPPMFILPWARELDIVGVALESAPLVRQGAEATVKIEGFQKWYRGRPLLLDTIQFPTFTPARAKGTGVMFSGRAEVGGVAVFQWRYVYQRMRELIAQTWTPAAPDVRHTASAFVSVPLSKGWAATGNVDIHTGVPLTPVEARLFVPSAEYGRGLQPRFVYGERNSARAPAYQRLDVGVRRTFQCGHAKCAFFGQVLNVLNRRNVMGYDWEVFAPAAGGASRPTDSRAGLPILPSFGLEAVWSH